MRRFWFHLIAVALLSGCHASTALLKPPLVEEGAVVLYVQPLPEEAERIRFRISAIVARRDDGKEFPLALSFPEFSAGAIKRQRFAASAVVPPGSYTGLAFHVRDAFLGGETGEHALLVTEGPVLSPLRFEVRKGMSFFIEATLRPAEAIRDRFSFTPSFVLVHPERPITALMGYVANYRSNNITVFNKKSGQVVDVIETGAGPRGIALDQALRRAYVALADEDAVDVIDVARNEIIHRIMLSAGDRPQEPALTRDGRLLVTANKGSDTVSIIDPVTFIERERISVGRGPNAVLIDSSGRRAYVFNTLSDSISIIDLVNRTVPATISTDAGPLRGQLNRKEDSLYVIHSLSSNLSIIDTLKLSLRQQIYVGPGASTLKINIQTDRIYLGRRHDPIISVYAPGLEMPVDAIPAGGGVASMAIDGDENSLYLVVPRSNSLRSVNMIGNRMIMELDVGADAYWVTLMGER
jgi:YVTN family beta-propeller protein